MADRYSFGHKALSVVLSVVLLGFGWPAVNPSETFASDESAQADQVQAEVAQPEETQAPEETADDSAAMALAAADEAAPVAASDERAVAEPAADESAMASAPSASGEEEASAVEDAVEGDSAVDNQGLSQAAAAQAKTEYDISLVLKNASIKKADGTDELVSLPATKVTVSADKDFKFTVVPDSACKLNRVLVNVAGQESPLTPDADGVYVVASSDIAKGATLTVEASSALGNVGTVLGGVLSGGAAAASDVSGNAGETTSAKVGDKVTLKGTSNKNCSYVGEWTVKKNGESTSAATIKGNGGSATAVFSEAGTFEIGHAYCEASHFLGFPGHSVKTETFTVVVQPATPARSISISGSDTVTQFSNIQLTATVDPAEATGTYEWSSSNEDILTVDNSGNVTGVRQGTATVTVSFISAVGGSEVSASKDVKVTATKDKTDQALVYYLLDPTKDANSNDSGHWGKTSLGIAMVNTTGATWAGGKNCFDNVDQRVVSWPYGTNVVSRDSDAWNEIFDNYKTTIQAQLPGVTFTKDDVEEIALVPAKISKNNGTNPDMHLDCNVSIKCKNVALVKYYLRDAGSTQFEQKGARNYISGNATQPSDVMNEQFPETKTVDGVTYTFSGWYLDRSFTQPATFPYTVNSSTIFYAKYVGGFRVAYDLAGGSWNNSDATTYIAQEGSTQTVKSEPTREGYKFTGWTIEGLPDTTALKSGDTFTMPAGNVTITANWQELHKITVKANSAESIYDGNKHMAKGFKTLEFTVDGNEYTVSGLSASVSGTDAGTYPNNVTGTAKVMDVAGNDVTDQFSVTTESGSLVINKAKATIEPKDATKAYDGTDLKASEFVTEGFVKDQGVKSATFTGSQLNVGTSKSGIDGYVLADGTNANNYDITKGTGNLEVTPVSDKVTVTITGNAATLKYDGTEQSVTGYTVACSNGLYTANDFDFTGAAVAKGTNVGTYKMGLEADQFSNTSANFTNVTFVVEDGWLKIEGGQIDANAVTWTKQDVQKVYDGKPLSAFAARATDKHGNELNIEYSIDGETWTFDPAEISLTHFGSQKVLLRATGSNYTAGQYATSSENIAIKKRPVTLTSASANKVYDGKPLTNDTVTSTPLGVGVGFLDGEGVTCNVTGSQTNVGESDNEFTYTFNEGTSKSDYLVTYEFGKLIVTQDNTEVVVTITEHSGAFEYDGTEKTVSGYDFSASNELYKNTDFEFTGNDSVSATNVGTYDMELKSENFKNTNGNFSKVTFVVVDGQLTITPKSVDPEAGKGMSVGKLPHVTYNGESQKQKPEVKDGNTLLTEGADYTLSYSKDTTNVGTVTVTVEGKGNYAGEAEVTYEIMKRQVALKSASASKVYDGTPLTKPGVTVGCDGFVEGEVSGLKAIGTVTNVADGEVDNEIVWDWAEGFGEGNYDITKTEGKLSIEPQSVDPDNPESYTGIKVGELSDLLYKGKDQFQEPTVTDAKGNLLVKDRDYTLAFDGDAKNVTEAGVSVTVSGIGNYKGDFSRSYKILPREVTVKSASASKAYDGTPLFSHDVVVTSAAGFVEDDVASMTAPNSITEVGSLTNEIAIEWSNDVAAGNYVVLKEEGVLEVTPKSVTAEGFSVEGLNDVTYNGLAQQQEPTVKDGDKTLTKDKDYTLSFTEDVTNVGTVRVTVTGKGNYTGSADVAYQILPAKLIVTTPSDSMVYNGKPLTAEGSIEGFVNNETAVFETTGSQTEVGESENAYAIYWSDEGTTAKRSNYTVEEHIGTLTVTEYADEIVAVANDVTMTYDGMPHRAEVTVTGVPEGYSVKTAWSGAEATDVTGADGLVANVDEIVVVNAEGKDVTDSLKITKKPGKLVIEPKELTVVTMGASKPYDGTPLTANGKIEGFVNGETAAFAVIGSQTEVGECTNAYTIEWSGNAKQGNYTVKEELGKLEVTKSQAAIVIVPKGGKKTYDGTPLVSEGADAYGLPAGFTCEATTKGSVTNVGSAVAEIDTYAIKNADGKDVTDQFGNVSTGFATLLVTKRPVTVVSEDASKVYDGTPLTKHEAGVTEGSMVDGESFVYEFTGIQTIAGESANSFIISAGDGTNLDNYEITKQEGTLKVEPKGIVPGEDNGMKVTKPVDKVYNGKEQKFVPVVTDGDKALVENVDYVVTYTDALGFEDDAAAKDDFTNVTGDIFVTVTGIGNYAGSLTQSYQITPKPYTVTTVSGSKVYDGTPLEGASLEGNFVGGLVNDDDATFVVTGTQTEVGASDNTYTLEFVDEQMAKNYKLVKEDIGTLTVVKDESEASQNPNGNGESKNKGTLPKTGDMTLATLPFALAVVAGAVLCAAPVARRRSKF